MGFVFDLDRRMKAEQKWSICNKLIRFAARKTLMDVKSVFAVSGQSAPSINVRPLTLLSIIMFSLISYCILAPTPLYQAFHTKWLIPIVINVKLSPFLVKGGLWRGLLLGWGGCGGGDWWAIDLDPLISGNLLKVRQRWELCPDGQIFVNYRPLCRGKLQIVVDRLFVHQSERRCSRSRNRKGMKRWICTITNVQLCSAINLIKVCHKLDLLQIKHIRRINPPLCHLLGPPPPL